MATDANLFVYGTLSTAVDHPIGAFMREHATLKGAARFNGRLYVVDDPDAPGQGSYPAARLSDISGDVVHGEIYVIRNAAAVFPELDDYEACAPNWPEPWEFTRKEITATMVDGGRVRTWAYLYSDTHLWNVERGYRLIDGRFRGERWSPDGLIPADATVSAAAE